MKEGAAASSGTATAARPPVAELEEMHNEQAAWPPPSSRSPAPEWQPRQWSDGHDADAGLQG
eukprot:2665430-Alexandrium_andersonii.AAC.1